MSSQLLKRKNRQKIFSRVFKYVYFTRGDIISFVYKHSGFFYFFIGICISVNNRSLQTPKTSTHLRNIVDKVPVDIIISVNCLMRFSMKFLDYMRKSLYYKASKLYYLRKLSNRFTKVYTYLYN